MRMRRYQAMAEKRKEGLLVRAQPLEQAERISRAMVVELLGLGRVGPPDERADVVPLLEQHPGERPALLTRGPAHQHR